MRYVDFVTDLYKYEMRDFTAPADSILGPANSLLRTGTRPRRDVSFLFIPDEEVGSRESGRHVRRLARIAHA